jgi:hypothetical protein
MDREGLELHAQSLGRGPGRAAAGIIGTWQTASECARWWRHCAAFWWYARPSPATSLRQRAEPAFLLDEVERAGVPMIGRLTAPATADGGDLCWLDEQTLAVGRG